MTDEKVPYITGELAQFVQRASWDAIPPLVRHEAKRALLNYFGCALGGSQDAAVSQALRVLVPFAGTPQASVFGHPERIDALSACFINGVSGNVLDFDDTHIPTVMHPTAPVASAVLACAEHHPASGREVLTAFVLGVDVACRIGSAVARGGHYRHGWHITATCGVFGSMVAVGKLLGLAPEQLIAAFAVAAGQASGIVENLGTMAKCVSVGNAARNGYAAALFAQHGYTGPERPLEGRFGFARVAAEGADLGAITRDLGSIWELLHNTYKPYPTGVVLNPVIDGCLEVRARPDFASADVTSIRVRAHPLLFERTDRPDVSRGREAVVSLQHTIAVVLLCGSAALDQYTDERVADPAVRALGRKVVGMADDTLPVGVAEVQVTRSNGATISVRVEKARGSLARPLTDSEIEDKLRQCVRYGAAWCDASRLIEAVWTLDAAPDLSRLVSLVVPDSR